MVSVVHIGFGISTSSFQLCVWDIYIYSWGFSLYCAAMYCSCPVIHTQARKSGNFHGALSSTGQHADPSVVCVCASHVELQGKEVCRPLCLNEKNALYCLEGYGPSFFCVCVCVFQCWTLYLLRCDSFLQPYLLLCNWLFSRRQTFLSKDTNVCSVVMDLLGVQLLNLAPFCVGVFCFGGFPRQNYFHKSG